MTWGFEVGRIYNRREHIHARFQGQQQGGIITPKAHNLILIITGEEGSQHGYTDQLRSDGVFEYYGEGQVGDMVMLRGNKALLDHAENGKDLLLFRKTKEGLRFVGQYVVGGLLERQAPDTEGKMRRAYVFELHPLEAIVEAVCTTSNYTETVDLLTLRKRAMAAAQSNPSASTGKARTLFERSQTVRDYILARANGVCEHCASPAPFTTSSGAPFLEVHHIRRLTDGGPDDPHFMIGLCPNCHRRAHYGADAKTTNEAMLTSVRALEAT